MKPEIHPNYIPVSIKCACGNVISTFSTRAQTAVDICSACHPFFTGKARILDTAGRVERFNTKYKRK